MKNKLRKIVVENKVYFYRIQNHIAKDTACFTELKIFLQGNKQTPLRIRFSMACDDYFFGFPLTSEGVFFNKNTNSEENINIHRPKFVQKFIILAQSKGWTGEHHSAIQNGMAYLSELGYEITHLTPKD